MTNKRDHYYVYAIRLSKDVLSRKSFMAANPDYVDGQPCVYVGMTGLDPETRFDKHKAGIKANRFARDYGECLMPDVVDDLVQPMSYEDAKYLEVDTAIRLRKFGFAVWQA